MIGTIKISQLPISSPLDGSENLIINQVGVTKLTTVDDVVGLVTYVSSSGVSTVSQGLTGSPDINVTNINSSGIITASGGFVLGISSSGTSITSGPITELNFIGTGNTFAVSGTSVDISIQGGGGGGESYWSSSTLGIHTLSNVGIATTDPIQKLQVGSAGTSVVVVDDNGNLGLGTTNPTSKIHCLGDINLDDGGTYATTLQVITPTADRVISYPDATGTLALVAGSSGQLIYNNAGANAGTPTLTYNGSILTSSGRFINSYNATASSPAKTFTGTWFTGGTATTTKPHVLIEPAGTTSTAWSTSGTGLGVNAPSGFTGNLLDLQVGGASYAFVNNGGIGHFGAGTDNAVRLGFSTNPPSGALGMGLWATGSGKLWLKGYANVYLGDLGRIGAIGSTFGFSNTTQGTLDTLLTRDAAGTLAQRNGTNAQTFRLYGTYTDASNYVRAALSSTSDAITLAAETAGTGADNITLNLTAAGTGTVKVNSVAEVAVSSTVAGLPTSPVIGMITRVTDASSPTLGATVSGGGSAAALVWYNGANWTVLGV